MSNPWTSKKTKPSKPSGKALGSYAPALPPRGAKPSIIRKRKGPVHGPKNKGLYDFIDEIAAEEEANQRFQAKNPLNLKTYKPPVYQAPPSSGKSFKRKGPNVAQQRAELLEEMKRITNEENQREALLEHMADIEEEENKNNSDVKKRSYKKMSKRAKMEALKNAHNDPSRKLGTVARVYSPKKSAIRAREIRAQKKAGTYQGRRLSETPSAVAARARKGRSGQRTAATIREIWEADGALGRIPWTRLPGYRDADLSERGKMRRKAIRGWWTEAGYYQKKGKAKK